MNTLFAIAHQFANDVTALSPLGNGLINDTFLVTTQSAPFVLQRINRSVFPAPDQIMANLIRLNRHLEQKSATDVKLKIPGLVKTIANEDFYQDEQGDYWRALSFIANTESLETLTNLNQAQQTGFALGHFHRLVSDLEPLLLYDTLPGFHISPDYLRHYHQVLTQSTRQLEPESLYCTEFIANNQHFANDLEAAKQQGLLVLRIIHGDPKLNNFLFDKDSKKVVSIIDLDTVKPGLVHYDIGDCLRSCCHDLATNTFDLTISTAILTSYLAEAGAFFTDDDYRLLYAAIRLIPFELGLRFYTDYLQGNRYFKVTEHKQNLKRAADQFRLCENIMAQEFAIKALIEQLKNHE
ncbi:phosphotransferase enzyme family protein [Methylobacter sp. S3L5C]|uniref:phosphotransferase enzyme family protein n=1 Tax=Methylobacter sp. S3L5C TaxID=2839024 RepID=UPI001FAB6865|nr:aminoglycoside phosphotransferase family protein [Methylobacter sp. S3L5C]UOA09898.1 aminoglycoside phosphotransferase family protein [Methylobacter sp. S3L5C]